MCLGLLVSSECRPKRTEPGAHLPRTRGPVTCEQEPGVGSPGTACPEMGHQEGGGEERNPALASAWWQWSGHLSGTHEACLEQEPIVPLCESGRGPLRMAATPQQRAGTGSSPFGRAGVWSEGQVYGRCRAPRQGVPPFTCFCATFRPRGWGIFFFSYFFPLLF